MTSVGFSLAGYAPANQLEAREQERINKVGDTMN